MSKNTERGMGQQGDPEADRQPDEPKGRSASDRPAVAALGPAESDRTANRPPRGEVGQITLLGVPAPVIEREKVTAPGRDIHLPAEARRLPTPRPAASLEVVVPPDASVPPLSAVAVPGPTARRLPTPRELTVSGAVGRHHPAPTMRISTPNGPPPGPANSPADARFAGPIEPEEREQESLLGERIWTAPGFLGSVALGVSIATVVAVLIVGVVRFGLRAPVSQAMAVPRAPSAPVVAPVAPLPPPSPKPGTVPTEVTLPNAPPSSAAANLPRGAAAGANVSDKAAGQVRPGPDRVDGTRADVGEPVAAVPTTEAAVEARTGDGGGGGADDRAAERANSRAPARPRASAPVDRPVGASAPPKRPIVRVDRPGPAEPTEPPSLSASPRPANNPPPPRSDETKAPYDPDLPLPPASE